MEKPIQLKTEEVDLNELRKTCQAYIDFIDNDEDYHEDNDFDHYIFEKALQAIFGSDVWEFVNNRQK